MATAVAQPSEVHAGRPRSRLGRALLVTGAIGAALLCVGYAVTCVYLASHLTAARHLPIGTPADVGLTYEPVAFENDSDHTPLKGWYIPSSGTRAIVLVHGLDGNRWETNSWLAELTRELVEDGFDVFTFDQRAHGESGGEHVGLGALERGDVRAAVRVVEQHGVPAGRVGLFGQSFGAATALNSAASIPDVAAVVSDSAFADPRDRLDFEIHRLTGLPPLFGYGAGVAAGLMYGIDLSVTPEASMAQITPRPVLLIHGTGDTRIPVANAYRLKAASDNPNVQLWIVDGAEHTMAYRAEPQLYTETIVSFFEKALGNPGSKTTPAGGVEPPSNAASSD